MADTAVEPRLGLTFEQVWAALMELRESGQETDRQMKEADRRLQETERLLRENSADFDRRMKRSEKDFNRRFGYLDNRFGELAERLVAPNIVKKFNALGYHFDDVGKERKFYRGDGTIAAEFDILLENGGVYCWSGGEAERAGRRGAYRAVGIFEGAEGRVRGQAEDTRGDTCHFKKPLFQRRVDWIPITLSERMLRIQTFQIVRRWRKNRWRNLSLRVCGAFIVDAEKSSRL